VKAIALLRQCQRQRTSGGEIIATVADYAVARELLEASFYAVAEEICPPVIQETVKAIGKRERRISEIELARRLGLSKPAVSWRAHKALEKGWLLNDGPPRGRPYRLRRGHPLPVDVPPLPAAHQVEGLFEGVPAPVPDSLFVDFGSELVAAAPGGVTAAAWGAWVKRDPRLVRQRLDALVAGRLLVQDQRTHRYGVLFWAPFWSWIPDD
jgi:hypothetical protein